MSRWIYGWILSALAILIILVPACNQFSQVAEETREKIEELSHKSELAKRDYERVEQLAREKRNELAIIESQTNRNLQRLQQSPVIGNSVQLLQRAQSEITIGSWNIKQFGVAKVANLKAMETLVNVVRQFDVLAIQEIRSKHDQTVLEQLVNAVNSNGSNYWYVISPLMGDTVQTEQLAFIYDTNRIELMDKGAVVSDPYQVIQREPMFSRFRTRTQNPNQAFTFVLANVHVTPSRSKNELAALYDIYNWLSAAAIQSYNEDDVILLGDFNERPSRYGALWQIQSLAAAVTDGTATNALQTKSYDNILFSRQTTPEFTNKSGVMDLQRLYGLSNAEMQDVSDHLPVWATFHVGEQIPSQFARQPGGVR